MGALAAVLSESIGEPRDRYRGVEGTSTTLLPLLLCRSRSDVSLETETPADLTAYCSTFVGLLPSIGGNSRTCLCA